MKRVLILILALVAMGIILSGCQRNTEQTSELIKPTEAETETVSTIDFEENQLYAVAYLGYEKMDDLTPYLEKYLNGQKPDTFSISGGEFYLIIPRYSDMQMTFFKNDIDGKEAQVVYESNNSKPFIMHCNVSDIFADATIQFVYKGEKVEYSPFISLKDGSVNVGERGLLIVEKVDESADISTSETETTNIEKFDDTIYIGEYLDADVGDPNLEIAKGEDGKYIVQIRIYRLTSLNDGVGELTADGMNFTATDAAGNSISGVITVENEIANITFTSSTWTYLENGSTFQYTKSSDIPHIWSE